MSQNKLLQVKYILLIKKAIKKRLLANKEIDWSSNVKKCLNDYPEATFIMYLHFLAES
jgi:hypothetical protein